MKTPIILAALAAALLVSACAIEDPLPVPDWPEVSTLYSAGPDVTCDGPVAVTPVSDVEQWCTFKHVLQDGVPHCFATVIFARPDTSSEWMVSGTFVTSANCLIEEPAATE